nr:hypothetical protein [Candidatus Methanomethylophilus sp. 1R26]
MPSASRMDATSCGCTPSRVKVTIPMCSAGSSEPMMRTPLMPFSFSIA